MLAPRTVIEGRFDVDSLAGSGGMGSVYRAWDRATGSLVAVKVMHTHAGAERFAREVALLAGLDHPGIVRFVAHGTLPDGAPFLVMEWLEGESLSARVEREALTVAEALALGQRVGEALGAAHRAGVVHRDLKPGNVFLVARSLEHVKLVDFGIARVGGTREELTHTGVMLGTPGYMAPEQVQAAQTVGPAADVYALGALLFRCLTGRRLYESDNPLGILLRVLMEPPPRLRTLRADAPPALDALVGRMLARDPAARPADGLAAARELWEVRQGHAVALADSNRTPVAAAGRCLLLAQIKAGDAGGSLMAGIAQAAAAHGVSPSALADGSLLVTPLEPEPLDRQMARLGRAALALRGLSGGIGSVLVAETASDASSAAGFDRGVALLTAVGPGQVRLDALAATLLTPPFEVQHAPEGASLVGVRGAEATFASGAVATPWRHGGLETTARPIVADAGSGERGAGRTALWAALGVGAVAATAGVVTWLATRPTAGDGRAAASGATTAATPGPVGSGTASAAPACSYERCVPVRLPDPEHVDVATVVPDAIALARSMEPSASLAVVALQDSVDGYFDARPANRAAALTFSIVKPDGSQASLQVMLLQSQLVAQHANMALALPAIGAPRCGVPAALRAARADGLPRSPTVAVTLSGSFTQPGTAYYQFVATPGAVTRFVDADSCRPTQP
ncbi:MAG: serine/threonine protein kinase [Myxococcales bacterium]|nr:serine/threonine protein kinase [Myxococcales bacterium]